MQLQQKRNMGATPGFLLNCLFDLQSLYNESSIHDIVFNLIDVIIELVKLTISILMKFTMSQALVLKYNRYNFVKANRKICIVSQFTLSLDKFIDCEMKFIPEIIYFSQCMQVTVDIHWNNSCQMLLNQS